jgi:hypothetical protein
VCAPDALPRPADGELQDARWFSRDELAGAAAWGSGTGCSCPARSPSPATSSTAGSRVSTPSVGDTAREVHDSRAVTGLARLGLASRGTVWLVVGLLLVSVLNGRDQSTDANGALRAIADRPYGDVLLVAPHHRLRRLRRLAGPRRRGRPPDRARRAQARLRTRLLGRARARLRAAGVPHGALPRAGR